MSTVSIMQPAYLPWLGYFDRIGRSQLHVILDHVPIDHNSVTKFTNRNKIRTANGSMWLTVPISTKGEARHDPITELKIPPDTKWQKKHWNTIRCSYSKAPFFRNHADFFESVFHQEWSHLYPLLEKIENYLLDILQIHTPRIRSSTLSPVKRKSELILEICQKVGASTYISGPFGRDYLDLESFSKVGISVEFHEYNHPTYNQLHDGFEPYMSVIDLIFNHGSNSQQIITGREIK